MPEQTLHEVPWSKRHPPLVARVRDNGLASPVAVQEASLASLHSR